MINKSLRSLKKAPKIYMKTLKEFQPIPMVFFLTQRFSKLQSEILLVSMAMQFATGELLLSMSFCFAYYYFFNKINANYVSSPYFLINCLIKFPFSVSAYFQKKANHWRFSVSNPNNNHQKFLDPTAHLFNRRLTDESYEEMTLY
ncbi:uncharacterized protein VP01_4675g2 [Puccinia sorghi]|uniref:Uncharacterized protein n=1 Tax=Puccinia sorghi TaxID=27349 RepID=A0A0L6UNY6_9BASI|nr:uncharacterized protein VP01_4675g2 [Puccinia sorghi]